MGIICANRHRDSTMRNPVLHHSNNSDQLAWTALSKTNEPLDAAGRTSGEFLSELLSQSVRRRVCYLVDMLLHFLPSLGLSVVIAIS